MKNKLKYMILIGIIAIITVPVLLMAFYAVPYNDDFSTIGDVLREMEKSGKGITTSALLLTLGRFKTWGGFYTGSFLNYAINPYMRWGMPGHQITIFLTTLFFIVTLLVFVRVMMKEIFGVESRIKDLVLGTAMLVCFLTYIIIRKQCTGTVQLYPMCLFWHLCSGELYGMPVILTPVKKDMRY